MKRLLGGCFALALPCVAWAGTTPFLITNRTSDLNSGVPAEAAMLQAFNATADVIESTINNGFLKESDRQSFADSLAKAGASPTAGFIADRSTNFSKFSVGGGAHGGFFWEGSATSSNANNQIPKLGASLQGALVFGIRGNLLGGGNVGPFDLKRLGIFVSTATGSVSQSGVTASIFNLGINFTYDLVPSRGLLLARWNGLKFLTGFNYATNSLTYSGKISQNSSTTVSGQTATVDLNMDYTIGAKNKIFYVPLEVSTGVQILYLFTVYAGGAMDLNFGTSSLIGTGSGPIAATGSSSFGAANLFSGTATLNLDDGTNGHPSTATMRGFLGVGLNLWVFHLDVQGSVMSGGAKAGALVGRIAL